MGLPQAFLDVTYPMESFKYASSSGLNIPVSIKIGSLTGQLDKTPYSVLSKNPELKFRGSNISFSDLYVTAQLWADSKPLSLPIQTTYKSLKDDREWDDRGWDEALTLPISYISLPRTAQLAVTVWDLLPSESATSDHRSPFGGTTIPLFNQDGLFNQGRQKCKLHLNKAADGMTNSETPHQISQLPGGLGEVERLEELIKMHQMEQIPQKKWLDQLAFRQINVIRQTRSSDMTRSPKANISPQTLSGDMFIFIKFARFEHPVVFNDLQYPPPLPLTVLRRPGDADLTESESAASGKNRLVTLFDPEIGMDNPIETKHRILVRSNRTGALEGDMRPSTKNRDELNTIMSYGPTEALTLEEKDLVWKYRHHLIRDKRALTKFIKSVSWKDTNETKQALELLPRWTAVDVEDALELLGPSFTHPKVRAFAVERLRLAADDELQLYLLQLVQALKYDHSGPIQPKSSLAGFLIERGAQSLTLGTALHWYLAVECDDRSRSGGRADDYHELFTRVVFNFMHELSLTAEGIERRGMLLRQGEMVTILTKLSIDTYESKESIRTKTDRVIEFLANPDNGLLKIDPPVPLPLDPNIMLVGCVPSKTAVFKSSMCPIKITFLTDKKVAGKRVEYPILFKTGDDLRQDQLVIQMITLMERLLDKEKNLDLKLSPYRIVATGVTAGMVQFVESAPISSLKTKPNGVLDYLQTHNPDPDEPENVKRSAMDTYIRSCAGYTVITYILGVGDRHLDNILLSPDGHFFHADFGFILGREPKPFAPHIRLTDDIVKAMGDQLNEFKTLSFVAYTTLRKSSGLILNLFALMTDSNIKDIRTEPDKAVFKVLERFHLNWTDEAATQYFNELIESSPKAILPGVMEHFHGLAQQLQW